MIQRPPLTRVWWTHLAIGAFAGGVTGALSMLWFGIMAIPFDPDGARGLAWLPLFSVFALMVGAAIASAIALGMGTALWMMNRVELGPRWYPPVGAAAGFLVMWVWSSDLRLLGQFLVAVGSATLAWRLTRSAEDVFSDYRS